jgi:hypothetical protein
MDFQRYWHELLEASEIAVDDTLYVPHHRSEFTVSDVEQHRIIVTEQSSGDSERLNKDTFRKLLTNIDDTEGSFDLDRLPPGTEVYAAVLSLHPEIEINTQTDTIAFTDTASPSQLLQDRESRSLSTNSIDPTAVSRDADLLVALLRAHTDHEYTELATVNLADSYALLANLQGRIDRLRRELRDVLLERMVDNQEVSGHCSRVARTKRFHRDLKDEEYVLTKLEEHGIDPDSVRGVDAEKVRNRIEELGVPESEFFTVEERDYIKKLNIDPAKKQVLYRNLGILENKPTDIEPDPPAAENEPGSQL